MTQNSDETGGARLTVYHDGACPLCQWEIGHYKRQAGAEAIDFVDVSQAGAETGPDLSRDAALGRFHVRDAQGRLRSGAAGFAALWRELPRFRRLGRVAGLPGVRHLLELFYRGFLPLRPALARLMRRFGRGGRRGSSGV
ncbi:MAG: DUF393 domain-containing protein [Roseovarius sp.]